MPPKRKTSKTSSTSRRKSTKRSTKKSKSKKKSTFRNKKFKKALPKIPRLTPQERAHGLSRIQKGEYQEGVHQPYIRSGKDVVVNPDFLNSAAYLSGGVPINADIDIDSYMDTSADYEPDPDMKRQTAESAARYNQMIDEKEQKRVTKELKTREAERVAEQEQRRQRLLTLDEQITDELNQLRDQSIQRHEAFIEIETPTADQLRAAEAAHDNGHEELRRINDVVRDLRELGNEATYRGALNRFGEALLNERIVVQRAISSSGIDLNPPTEEDDPDDELWNF
jgi:hypothetical protein